MTANDSLKLYVATRKGLFVYADEGGNGVWKNVDLQFLGDPVTMVLPDPRDGSVYAALNLGHFGVKFHRSQGGLGNWEEVSVPSFLEEESAVDEATPNTAKETAPSVFQVWALEAGGPDHPDRLWAGTIPAALFCSEDKGQSWELVDSLWNLPQRAKWFGGGYDDAGIHSICLHPQDSDRVTVGISCGGVWFTEDGGETWEVRTQGIFADYMPPESREDPDIQDPHRLVQSPSSPDVYWVQHHNGIFRTTDSGRNWTAFTEVSPSSFGFAVAVHPNDPETAWFVPAVKDQCRVPVDGKVVLTRTSDGGKSFEILSRGLPERAAYDIVYRHGLDVDPSGDRLAVGSTTGGLWASNDRGESWACVSQHLPPVYAVRFGW